LAKEAPSIEIIFKGPDPKNIEGAMAAGSLDIAIGYLPEASNYNALIKSTLFREPFVCIARRGHPALQDGVLSLDRFVQMQHVQAL
jgi:DNA-binding transcriptional LysR family regulator